MNTILKLTRFVFALVLALSAISISTSTALADGPTKIEYVFTSSSIITGVCSFPIGIEATVSRTEIRFFDKSGSLTRMHVHGIEQDTFTANGKTLVGMPYRHSFQVLYDSSGNVIHSYSNGILEKIRLPDGSLFISAGRVDFAVHPGAIYILSPDQGHSGNIAEFCAALSS